MTKPLTDPCPDCGDGLDGGLCPDCGKTFVGQDGESDE